MKLKIDKRGTITIPKIIRETLDIQCGDILKIEVVEDKLIITNPKEDK